MIITFLGCYILIVGLMIQTLFQNHRCARNKNCVFFKFLSAIVEFCMVATYIKKIMHSRNHGTLVCVQGKYFTCFWLVKCLGLLKTLIHHKCNKCQTLHDGTYAELYQFIMLSVTLTLFQGHNSVKQLYLKSLWFYLIKLKLCRCVKCSKLVMNIPLFFISARVQER